MYYTTWHKLIYTNTNKNKEPATQAGHIFTFANFIATMMGFLASTIDQTHDLLAMM